MPSQPAIVFIVVDRGYGARFAGLPPNEPVWIVDHPHRQPHLANDIPALHIRS